MLRVRFHGRGGHGMKTASRILGTAAFRSGLCAQDSPVYGAERRGAPIAAFTRIDRTLVLERGSIAAPDIVVIADDSLLDDPLVAPLSGLAPDGILILNSANPAEAVRERYSIPEGARVFTLDVTETAQRILGHRAAVSAAMGVLSCRAAGIADDAALAAAREELSEIGLPENLIRKNEELARACLAAAEIAPLSIDRPEAPEPPVPLIAPAYDDPTVGTPSVYAPGNMPLRKTGGWRTVRPVIDLALCNQCWICFVRCPEGAISLDEKDNPHIDYDHCKGCLICVEECPTKAVAEEKEVRTW